MSGNKTKMTDASVSAFLSQVMPEKRAQDSMVLNDLFQTVTGYAPRLWGDSIIGYGQYHYRYASGREGDFLATGFAPRKKALSIYIMPGYSDFGSILSRLGKHKTGRACLYVNKLEDIRLDVLSELIQAGLADLQRHWDVEPS